MLCLNMNVWRQFSIFCAYYGWPQLSSCDKVITWRFSVWPHVSLCNHLTVEEFRCFSSRPVVARWSPIGLLAYVTGTLEKHLCCTIKIHSSLNKSHSPGATFLKYSFCARISFSTWVYPHDERSSKPLLPSQFPYWPPLGNVKLKDWSFVRICMYSSALQDHTEVILLGCQIH